MYCVYTYTLYINKVHYSAKLGESQMRCRVGCDDNDKRGIWVSGSVNNMLFLVTVIKGCLSEFGIFSFGRALSSRLMMVMTMTRGRAG